jgi:ATP-binding protein involved in chromosome partitioning
MFHQVKVELIGMVENMSHFTCPHCHEVIDIFSTGGAERTARQFGVDFLGSVELDASIRSGGDRGMPVTLAGPENATAKAFYAIAEKVAERARKIADSSEQILEIS